MSRKPAFVLQVAVLALSLQFAAAQDVQNGSAKQIPPLSVTAEFSTAPGDCSSATNLTLQFHYFGPQPLRGYLVRLAFYSTSGKPIADQTVHEIRDSRNAITSGANWSRIVCSAAKTNLDDALTISPMVDVLKFDDGSVWGPTRLPASHELIGAIDGMDFSVRNTDLLHYVSPISTDTGPLPQEQIHYENIGPLRFESGIWRDDHGQAQLAAEATNIADKPIRGYVFTESFFDSSSGNRLRRVTTKQLETNGDSAHFLLPGATWVSGTRKFSHSADGTLANYTIALDFVVFADGSTFGPKQSRESDEVLGMLRGIDSTIPSARAASAAKNQ